MKSMTAAVYNGGLNVVRDYPVPDPKPGWARVRVKTAGICKTDLEIVKGYMGFAGVLGHEFVGTVESCAEQSWVGKRVVGEINASCGHCPWCEAGLGRHCPNRTTLGILNHDGCFAEFCLLPAENLHVVPAEIPDDRAVLTEPLSAACEILEQRPVGKNERVIVLGDGRLGILCAWVLSTASSDVTIVGRHPAKLQAARWKKIRTASRADEVPPGADLVVEATGSGSGIVEAMSLCRPRGTIVLKSTVALQGEANLAPLVINEQTLLGSRCGRFVDGLKIMKQFPDMPLDGLITDRFPLRRAEEAFDRAGKNDALKILLDIQV